MRSDIAEQSAILAQRDDQYCPGAGQLDGGPADPVIRTVYQGRHIRDVDQRLAREQSPPDIEAGLERLAQQLGKRLGDTVCRRGPELVAIVNRQMTVSRAAEAVRFLQNRIEH